MKFFARRDSLIGPLAGWELVRLARRGQTHRARLLVLYLLAFAFALTPILWFPHDEPLELFTGTGPIMDQKEEVAALANRFALVILEVILAGVVAMTPAYAAAAIAEEKERQTLPLLLTSGLTDREIVLGKAVGRLGFVLAAAAAGIPVLATTMLFGGVDGGFLAAGCGLVVSTATLATAIGVQAACAATDLRALLRAYGTTAVLVCGAFVPPVVFISPFSVLVGLEGAALQNGPISAWVAVGYSVIQFAVAGGLLASAIRRLRSGEFVRPPPAGPPTRAAARASDRAARTGKKWDDEWDRPIERRLADLPPVDDADPVGWKERQVAGRPTPGTNSPSQAAAYLFGGLAGILMVIGAGTVIARLWSDDREKNLGGHLLMAGGAIAAGTYMTAAAVGLASAIARERRRQTLDALLTLPMDRRDVLVAKVRAVLRCGVGWWLTAAPATAIAFWADGGWRLGLAAGVFALAGAALVVGLGAWLTVRCPTEVRAFRLLIPAVVVVVGAPVGVWNAMNWSKPGWPIAGLEAAAVAAGVAGAILWRSACRAMDESG